jgi:uncharacterized membrane protein
VKAWALAHLLANVTVADVLLFGGFLIWAVFSFIAARRRDRLAGTTYPVGTMGGTPITVVAGSVAWALFAVWLHGVLIGAQHLCGCAFPFWGNIVVIDQRQARKIQSLDY